MSLSSLANDEILRTDRKNLDMSGVVERRLPEILAKAGPASPDTPALREIAHSLATEPPVPQNPGSNALDSLVKYIPTEAVTLYVAATSALSSIKGAFPEITPASLYWGFVVFTPVLFLLIYLGKRRSQKLTLLPAERSQLPWWPLVASTIAFGVWALAVPPLVTTDGGKIVAAFGALLVSTLLTVIGSIVQPPP